MTEKRNIVKTNRKELSSSNIKEKENIERVLKKHRRVTKRPAYKQKKFYFFLFFLLAIIFILYYTEKEEGQKEKKQQTERSR